jgi:hypothetical protein
MAAPAQANDGAARKTKFVAVLVLYDKIADHAKRAVVGYYNFHLITHSLYPLCFRKVPDLNRRENSTLCYIIGREDVTPRELSVGPTGLSLENCLLQVEQGWSQVLV